MESKLKIILLKTGIYRNLFDTQNLICGKESAADSYAIAHYGEWWDFGVMARENNVKELFNSAVENLRLLSENCSSLQGFLITHSIGGGTGSGLTSRLMEKIAAEYGNGKSKSRISNYQFL